MKTFVCCSGFLSGYSLTEVIIAVGVVAISVPLVLALVVAGSESSQLAERETRAVFTARAIFEEVALAQEGESLVIAAEELPWVASGEADATGLPVGKSGAEEWLILELDSEGDVLASNPELDYQEAWTGATSEVRGLAAIRGYRVVVEEADFSGADALEVFQVELRVEYPARAKAGDRRGSSFIKVNSAR